MVVLVQPAEQLGEVGSGAAPVERGGGLLVAALEAEQAVLDLGQVGEVVGVSTLRCTIEQ